LAAGGHEKGQENENEQFFHDFRWIMETKIELPSLKTNST
jgi:hypothetical protein